MRGKWITTANRPNKTGLYSFRKILNIPSKADMTISVCADTSYQLYINDKFVVMGPCRGGGTYYYETKNVSEYIRHGENCIRIEVLHIADDFYTTALAKDRPALWFYGEIKNGDKISEVYADKDWEIWEDNSVRFYIPKVLNSMPPFEERYYEKKYINRQAEVLYECELDRMCCNSVGTIEKYPLKARSIPEMKLYPRTEMREVKRGRNFIEYDAGEYVVAYPELTIGSNKATRVKVIYAECYVKKNNSGTIIKNDRTDCCGMLEEKAFDYVHSGCERVVFKPFWFRSFRYIRIEWEEAEPEIESLVYQRTGYPLEDECEFECSDDTYNKLWKVGLNTLRCCASDILVDCPFYEQQQYNMDFGLEMIYWFRITSDSRLIKKCLYDLASGQTASGLMPANFPSRNIQIIPNFSFYFIFAVTNYLKYTDDVDTAKELAGTVDKVLSYFENMLTDKGVVGVCGYWAYVDWSDGWKDGVPTNANKEPVAVASMMYSAALMAAEYINNRMGRKQQAAVYGRLRCKLNENIIGCFYDEDRGLFKDTLNTQEYSQHTVVWAILAEIVDKKCALRMSEYLINDDIRQTSFAMSYYKAAALEKVGRYKDILPLLNMWETMLDNNCTTWSESLAFPRSECHGWSSVPTYILPEVVLGVSPTAEGFRRIKIRPETGELSYARGNIPTPYGKIYVEWRKTDRSFAIKVQSDYECIKEIYIPGHKQKICSENFVELKYEETEKLFAV